MEKILKLGIIGTGFWADFQINAWKELEGVEIVALCDQNMEKAQAAAKKHSIIRVYTDIDKLLDEESLDCIDIISSIDSHKKLVLKTAAAGVNVICQKPMTDNFVDCQAMVDACKKAGVKFFIHENFRWQTPIRACKELIKQNTIGKPFRSKLTFCSGFPVFDNQPALKDLDRFIIMDLGVHLLDTARFLFGDVARLYCQTQKINESIKGEDIANILLTTKDGLVCFTEISYASHLEKESFPQTLMLIEGDTGSIRLDLDHQIVVTRKNAETTKKTYDPPRYDWADPAYALVHSSIVDCNKNILQDLMGEKPAETTGTDNLKTMELVFLSYESALTNQSIATSL
ncbi:Gfo/Idh/MocA family protein [Aquiflexum sp.]|uniref:Gfo/Idh/MocA family protein n=1 Tax=Aquiflexum sp. TaxID=1872584 RepID=UPI003593C5F0